VWRRSGREPQPRRRLGQAQHSRDEDNQALIAQPRFAFQGCIVRPPSTLLPQLQNEIFTRN
jgi:hypothetical protein